MGYLNDLWEWDGTSWTQRSDGHDSPPPPRVIPATAYQPACQTFLMFGGAHQPPSRTH